MSFTPGLIEALRQGKGRLSAVELAGVICDLSNLTQGSLVFCFGRAFPQIPLNVLLASMEWNRVVDNGSGMTDDEFNKLLEPWLAT